MEQLTGKFGKKTELTKECRAIQNHLGMRVDFSMPGSFALSMFDYQEDIVVEAPDDLKPNNCMQIPYK